MSVSFFDEWKRARRYSEIRRMHRALFGEEVDLYEVQKLVLARVWGTERMTSHVVAETRLRARR